VARRGFRIVARAHLQLSRASTANAWRAHQTAAVAKNDRGALRWQCRQRTARVQDGPSFHLSEQTTISLLDADLTGVFLRRSGGGTTQRRASGDGAATVWGWSRSRRRHSRKDARFCHHVFFFFARSNRSGCVHWQHLAPWETLLSPNLDSAGQPVVWSLFRRVST
jgi:hypothetical protein